MENIRISKCIFFHVYGLHFLNFIEIVEMTPKDFISVTRQSLFGKFAVRYIICR